MISNTTLSNVRLFRYKTVTSETISIIQQRVNHRYRNYQSLYHNKKAQRMRCIASMPNIRITFLPSNHWSTQLLTDSFPIFHRADLSPALMSHVTLHLFPSKRLQPRPISPKDQRTYPIQQKKTYSIQHERTYPIQHERTCPSLTHSQPFVPHLFPKSLASAGTRIKTTFQSRLIAIRTIGEAKEREKKEKKKGKKKKKSEKRSEEKEN